MRSVIFDIDGTLWDSRAIVAEGYNEQLRKEGLEELCVTPEVLKTVFGKVMTEIADIILEKVPAPQRYDLMERCMKTEQGYLKSDPCNIAYPDVKKTLEALSARNRLFIVSNSQAGYPELIIEKLGLSDLIEGHLCFGDTGTDKGTTITRLMKQYDIKTSEAVYVGDTQGDLEASRKAGIPFVWASYGFGTPETYDYRIERFSQLAELF